eukprot:CAMPEP_0181325134 /NCGR_PEP_ID=MMETSP1101-20121128/20753_1 /TAXON_ID=46948 /ORGANISM="Rhodomonas abbreviata, Strain Caron Lab Isolate" /LENGTH=165 /DNA_ID=CAMNT_0023433401 /DNA_START=514 /DNA_END=1008 /DNA_ORIENTATION=+
MEDGHRRTKGTKQVRWVHPTHQKQAACAEKGSWVKAGRPQKSVGGNPSTNPEWGKGMFFPQVERIVAIGDVHGDVNAMRRCLEAACLVDEEGDWAGGSTHLVLGGDILDREDTEIACLDLLLRLRPQARAAGGRVHVVLGNHEVLNVDNDFRYVSEGGFAGWGEW